MTGRSVKKIMSPRLPEQNEEIREATKRKIRQTALALFAETGYSATSISAIAKAAGISKGLMYNYFQSKEDLLLSIVEELSKVGTSLVDNHLHEPPIDRLRALLDGAVAFYESQPGLMRFMIMLAMQQEAIAALKPFLEGIKRSQLEKMIALFEELGYDNPEAEAHLFGAALDGTAFGLVTLGQDYPHRQVIDLIRKKYNL